MVRSAPTRLLNLPTSLVRSTARKQFHRKLSVPIAVPSRLNCYARDFDMGLSASERELYSLYRCISQNSSNEGRPRLPLLLHRGPPHAKPIHRDEFPCSFRCIMPCQQVGVEGGPCVSRLYARSGTTGGKVARHHQPGGQLYTTHIGIPPLRF